MTDDAAASTPESVDTPTIRRLGLFERLSAKRAAERLWCSYCGAVPVSPPGMFCSDDCSWSASLEDSAT